MRCSEESLEQKLEQKLELELKLELTLELIWPGAKTSLVGLLFKGDRKT